MAVLRGGGGSWPPNWIRSAQCVEIRCFGRFGTTFCENVDFLWGQFDFVLIYLYIYKNFLQKSISIESYKVWAGVCAAGVGAPVAHVQCLAKPGLCGWAGRERGKNHPKTAHIGQNRGLTCFGCVLGPRGRPVARAGGGCCWCRTPISLRRVPASQLQALCTHQNVGPPWPQPERLPKRVLWTPKSVWHSTFQVEFELKPWRPVPQIGGCT